MPPLVVVESSSMIHELNGEVGSIDAGVGKQPKHEKSDHTCCKNHLSEEVKQWVVVAQHCPLKLSVEVPCFQGMLSMTLRGLLLERQRIRFLLTFFAEFRMLNPTLSILQEAMRGLAR